MGGEDLIMVLTNLHLDVTEQEIKDHLQNQGKIKNAPRSFEWIPTKKADAPKKAKIELDPNENLVQTAKNLNLSKLKEKEVFVSWIRKRMTDKQKALNMKRYADKKKAGEAKKQIIKTKNVKLKVNPFMDKEEVSKLNTKKAMTAKGIKNSKGSRGRQKGRKVW